MVEPRPDELSEGWEVRILTLEDPEFVAAETLEYSIFVAEGFVEESDQRRASAYEPYRHESRFHAVIDPDGCVVGCVRTLVGPWRDLPVGKFSPDGWDPDEILLEYASLVVDPQRRSSGVAEALYRSVWIEGRRSGAVGLAALLEEWLLSILCDYYGFGFSKVSDPRWYMGGACVAAVAPFGVLEGRLPADRQRLWQYLCRPVPREELALWGVELDTVEV